MQVDRIESMVEQQIAIPSADETWSTPETVHGVHRYIFDTLAFFSGYPSSLIADDCQDIENVLEDLSLATASTFVVLLVEADSTVHQRRTYSPSARVLQ